MSKEHLPSESWVRFWNGLEARLANCDLTSRGSTKFAELAEWLTDEWNISSGEVVCKYVQHEKNRWNRLREASRRHPAAILLLFEGDEVGDVKSRLQECAAATENLGLVFVLLRPSGDQWFPGALFYREGIRLPDVLSDCAALPDPVKFSAGSGPDIDPDLPPFDVGLARRLVESLDALGIVGGDPQSPHRSDAINVLSELSGVSTDGIAVKTVRSTKNLANRLGEALARAPSILIVVCPEVFEDRVLDEALGWSESGRSLLILVLCGEQTTLRAVGAKGALLDRVCSALESGPDLLIVAEPEPHAFAMETVETCAETSWREWSYEKWNRALISHYLGSSAFETGPVERLAATPEELALIAGEERELSGEVAGKFVEVCTANVPSGKSFCGFCGDYSGRRPASKRLWSFESTEPPHYFAMLFLTCLISYGYPDTEGGFHERYERIAKSRAQINCLPDLWVELAAWAAIRNANGDPVRRLDLPPRDEYRKVIGHSHFLAFPHKYDRQHLAEVLVDADLVGYEPPIRPVLSALAQSRDRFSELFLTDMDRFMADYSGGAFDPRDSAFWRAVRQEALQPSSRGSSERSRKNRTSMLGVIDDDGFLPILGCTGSWSPPLGFSVCQLDNPIGDYSYYVVADSGGHESVAALLFESLGLLGPGPRALLNQGVLVFQEDQSEEFYLVSGHDINGADVALVRDDRMEAFVAAFGGQAEPSRIQDWHEVSHCSVRPLDDIPSGLEGVHQLMRTMSPPSVRFVGGIRVPGGYLGFGGFLPRVRVPGASSAEVLVDGEQLPCLRESEDEWSLPPNLLEHSKQFTVKVVARWKTSVDTADRTSERSLVVFAATIDDQYKFLSGGDYFLEGCCPGERQVPSGSEVGLSITSSTPSGVYDLLGGEPSARYLGPGLGEMAMEALPGFDWLAVGPKKRPELLVFIGDIDSPGLPKHARSQVASDRSHWRCAFNKARTVIVRAGDGTYSALAENPAVAAAYSAYRKHDPPSDSPPLPETRLPTVAHEPPSRTDPGEKTYEVVDAIAALSSRRGGLRYRSVQQLIEQLLKSNDYSLQREIIRAWFECGMVDVVRNQSYSATRIVARRPRFVAARRGMNVEASLLGLVTRARIMAVKRAAIERGVRPVELKPGNPWQPGVIRVTAEKAVLDAISEAAELEPMEWFEWCRGDGVPVHFLAAVDNQQLRETYPPQGYRPEKWWDWEVSGFTRFRPESDEVVVEQRMSRDYCSIYVVTIGGDPALWTYLRNWALLYACEISDRRPFVLDRKGWITTSGRTPVHLPLSLGRLCTVLGEGLPGPVAQPGGVGMGGYCYPFGRRMTDMVSKVLPADWFCEETE